MRQTLKNILKRVYDFFSDRRMLISFFTLYMLLIIIPFQLYGDSHNPAIRFYYWTYCLWTVFIALNDFFRKEIKWNIRQTVLIIFWIGCFISFLVKGRPFGIIPIRLLMELAMLVYVFYSLPYHYTKKQTKRFVLTLMTLVIIVLGALVISSVIFDKVYGAEGGYPQFLSRFYNYAERFGKYRYAGIFWSSPLTGAYGCYGIVITLYLATNKKMPAWLAAILIAACADMVYLSRARTGVVIFAFIVVCALIYITVVLVKKEKYKPLIVFWVVLLLAAVIGFTRLGIMDKIKTFMGYSTNLENFSGGRMSIWIAAIEAFKEKPIFGWGFFSGPETDAFVLSGWNTQFYHTHNLILSLLMWTGLVGTIPFIIFLIMLIVRMIKRRSFLWKRGYYWMIVLMFCTLIGSMLDPGIVAEDVRLLTPLFWIACSII